MDNVQRIQDRIDLLNSLILRVNDLPAGVTDRETAQSIVDECKVWKEVTASIVMDICGQSDPHLFEFGMHWRAPLRGQNFKAEMIQKLKRAKTDLEIIVEIEKEKATRKHSMTTPNDMAKTPKVFISHKKEDKAYADALVSLINFILGADGDKIFCSSIPGYGIRQSRDILDELKRQFDQYEIYMVIIHSPRYYQSAICLNEMGASWALGTRFSSFMTNDCKLENLHGVINQEKICIDLNDDPDMLNGHLNEFKDDLIEFFHSNEIDQTKWENARGRFIKEVKSLTYDSQKEDSGEVTTIKRTPNQLFTEEEYGVLRQWVESGNNTAFILGVLGGKLYVLGNIEYDASSGRQEAYWNDFLKRMQMAGFVELDHYDSHGSPVYELQNSAYEYFEEK